jgi:hypothetical protein
MKLILKFEQDCSVPCAWCEVCNTEITDAEMAMVYWHHEDYQQALHAPLLAHDHCMPWSRCMDEGYDCTMELPTYLAFLLKNVGLTGRKFTEAIQTAGLISTIR